MKFEYQDKIDRYVHEEMSNEERKSFEKEMSENDELRDQLLYTQKVKYLMSSRAEKLKKMRQWQEDDDANRHSKVLWYWTSGIAAVLLVGIFVVKPIMLYQDALEEVLRGADDVFLPSPKNYESLNYESLKIDSIAVDSINILKDEE